MYSLLVVEDEKWIRKGIVHKLKKIDVPFDMIYDAKNGIDALEIIEEKHIDIIITDICMPDMNGIELIRKVKNLNEEIEFIIISGYSEFRYAEAAINMGVKSYLLKPTTEEDLITALSKAVAHIEEKKQYNNLSKENINIKIFNDKLQYEKEINTLFKSHDKSSAFLQEKYPSMYNSSKFKLIILNINFNTKDENKNKYYDINEVKKNIFDYLVNNIHYDNYCAFNNIYILNQIFILVWGDKNNVKSTSNRVSKKIFYECLESAMITKTIGISSILDRINDELYKSAKKALDLRLIYGLNKIYTEEYVNVSNEFTFPKDELKLIKKNLERGYMKNVKVLLLDIFSKNRFNKSNVNNLYFLYSEVVNIIYETVNQKGLDMENIMDYDLSQYDIMNYANNLEDIPVYLYKLIENTLTENKKNPINCRELINQITKYIDMHYEEKISVKSLSSLYGINSNYFSTIFKEQLGMTCTKYITMKRLNHACRMLRETDISIEDIAKSVGYNDIQYFYRVFKKEYNYTPMEYRNGA
ncbi:DNA-binding response regulator [Vallitalea longa]|uniref:Stage 0 sporulation protein A homolog n=1 Tax=Vallitalea longa TaxID=2936439 RepID=A0A9W5YDS2_9FIRM|nr:response regulator [Vallitalea longa]GKX32092.1 DNA-binding response regulator [Vallitalea longa]